MAMNDYEKSIWEDVREHPMFDEGMRVRFQSRGEMKEGKIIKRLPFSEFWLSHKYDVMTDEGRFISGMFECDLRRVTGFKLRALP